MAERSDSVCPASCAHGVASDRPPVPPCLNWQRAPWVDSKGETWPMSGVRTGTALDIAAAGGSGDIAPKGAIVLVRPMGTLIALMDQF